MPLLRSSKFGGAVTVGAGATAAGAGIAAGDGEAATAGGGAGGATGTLMLAAAGNKAFTKSPQRRAGAVGHTAGRPLEDCHGPARVLKFAMAYAALTKHDHAQLKAAIATKAGLARK